MDNYKFYDIDKQAVSPCIDSFFEDWMGCTENLCVFSPHDDDALIGCGYAMTAAMQNGAAVFVVIFCRGNAGYSTIDEKDSIEKIREAETLKAYEEIGVPPQNIFRFNYSDFSVIQHFGWQLNGGSTGAFEKTVKLLRELKITRLLIPNHHREHIDHTAVSLMGVWDASQAGDPILADWGYPQQIKTVMEYSVWADLSPVDALNSNRNNVLRANRIISSSKDIEDDICRGIVQYRSQGKIIQNLIMSRQKRKTKDHRFIEVYLRFEPRPELDYLPYLQYVETADRI
jgi:LmbE family N-acetylglucosaminyl deacetylase